MEKKKSHGGRDKYSLTINKKMKSIRAGVLLLFTKKKKSTIIVLHSTGNYFKKSTIFYPKKKYLTPRKPRHSLTNKLQQVEHVRST